MSLTGSGAMKFLVGAALLGFFAAKTYLTASSIGPKLKVDLQKTQAAPVAGKTEWWEVCGKLLFADGWTEKYGQYKDLSAYVVPIAGEASSGKAAIAVKFLQADYDRISQNTPSCVSGLTDTEAKGLVIINYGQTPTTQLHLALGLGLLAALCLVLAACFSKQKSRLACAKDRQEPIGGITASPAATGKINYRSLGVIILLLALALLALTVLWPILAVKYGTHVMTSPEGVVGGTVLLILGSICAILGPKFDLLYPIGETNKEDISTKTRAILLLLALIVCGVGIWVNELLEAYLTAMGYQAN